SGFCAEGGPWPRRAPVAGANPACRVKAHRGWKSREGPARFPEGTRTMRLERTYHAASEQANAGLPAADPEATQADMAHIYQDCIIADLLARRDHAPGVDFGAVNRAVTARWPKGLDRIKRLAWKRLEQTARRLHPEG